MSFVLKRISNIVSFSALVVCLCWTVLNIGSVFAIYPSPFQVILLAALVGSFIALSRLVEQQCFERFIRSSCTRLVCWILLSPAWLALLSLTEVHYGDHRPLGYPELRTWFFLMVPLLGIGYAMLIATWFYEMRDDTDRDLFGSSLPLVIVAVALFVPFFSPTYFGALYFFILTILACLPICSRVSSPSAASPAEHSGWALSSRDRFLMPALCMLGLVFLILGGIALGFWGLADSIFFAGALMVLGFFGVQIYLNSIKEPMRWGRVLLGSASLIAITFVLGLFLGFTEIDTYQLEIVLFGATCFIIGMFFLIAFITRLTSEYFMRTSMLSLAAFYLSSLIAVLLVDWYVQLEGRNVENDVFILLLLSAIAIAWILFLIFSQRKPSELLLLLAGDDAIITETVYVEDPTFDESCQELADFFELTARESEVLPLLARGKTAAAIATELFISRNTVSTHTKHIYSKLGINSQDQLIELVDSSQS